MPTHKSAMKRLRQSKDRRLRNRGRKSQMKATLKNLTTAITDKQGPDKEKVTELYKAAVSIVARTSSKGTIHSKTASRKIGRLTKSVNRAMGPDWLGVEHPKPTPAPEPEVVEEAVVEEAQAVAAEAAPETAAEALPETEGVTEPEVSAEATEQPEGEMDSDEKPDEPEEVKSEEAPEPDAEPTSQPTEQAEPEEDKKEEA